MPSAVAAQAAKDSTASAFTKAIVGVRRHRGNPSGKTGAHDARVCARHDVVRWSSAASAAPRLAAAVEEAAATVRAGLGGVSPDLVAAFVSPRHQSGDRLLPSP